MYNDDMLVSRTEMKFTHWNLHSCVNKVIVLVLPQTFLEEQHVKTGKIQPEQKHERILVRKNKITQ